MVQLNRSELNWSELLKWLGFIVLALSIGFIIYLSTKPEPKPECELRNRMYYQSTLRANSIMLAAISRLSRSTRSIARRARAFSARAS